ncbi:MAG: UDP-N-acetylmuramoyl-L-alanyl-D-glutamate--2,6-diaminopimelate ligase [Candidatus Schekmanbacteria bacterium RBG_13_48_7]|uniref:UDP-N-acetylmuramyl-tripeptide synthetase n=1 Tax=Candidatus Schekmanbacteria bacterium RBG_13_48_7 TaxID=1817878 RepID=A0A1F7RPB8_9BACT|nr:MAG: UDP-N-acetylmuramoyl-L-alanyl-D-glutamate--2,6-diaminopimelate ligase [Candidatus Schekmanbacteria bacterium RBG_13_48_7]
MVKLNTLIKTLDEFKWYGLDTDLEINSICCDSKTVVPGCLFICLRGSRTDGHNYVNEAIEKGAVAVLTEKKLDINENKVVIQVANSRKSLGPLAAAFYDFPSSRLNITGITGTNGKTTTSFMIHSIFRQIQIPAGILGTVGCRIGEKKLMLKLTTPEALEIQKILHEMVQEGITHVVMEVSSHGLDLHRVKGINFKTAVFTNITMGEHLDYHKTFENYLQAKLKLFQMVEAADGIGIFNRDDPNHAKLFGENGKKRIFYGIDNKADIMASRIKTSISGTRFLMHTPSGNKTCTIKIPGYYNVYNALAASSLGIAHGIDLDAIIEGLENLEGVPGRFQRIDQNQNFAVIVDYAHTSDALSKLLNAARGCNPKKLITIFGCGGDRDPSKRPEMGRIATELSDHVFVTTDNCRSELPPKIINDIIQGMHKNNYKTIPDREEAICTALKMAEEGDMVVIAGKGHETYQIFNDRVTHFDDREVCRRILNNLGYKEKTSEP